MAGHSIVKVLFITQRVDRAEEGWEHLTCVYTKLLAGIYLACVSSELATARHVHVPFACKDCCTSLAAAACVQQHDFETACVPLAGDCGLQELLLG